MPHEGYIKKQDLNDFQINGIQEQDTSEEWKAYHKMQTSAATLKRDTRTQFLTGKKKADSALMKDVKDATEALTRFYTETTISDDEDDFEEQLKQAMTLYDTLQKNCRTYLENRGKNEGWKRFRMGEGYRRRRMVEKTLARASVERNLLENRAKLVFAEFEDVMAEQERPLWVNVLAETRTRQLDFSHLEEGSRIEHTGGNTSTVLKLVNPNKGEVAYIKEEEMNVPAQQMTEKYISEYLNSDFVKGLEEEGIERKSVEKYLIFLNLCCQYSDYIRSNFINTNGVRADNFLDKNKQARFKALLLDAEKRGHLVIPEEVRPFLDNAYAGQIAGEFGAYFYRCNMTEGIATGMARIAPNANITVRNVATYRLAELLGIADIIPATMRVKYKDTAGKDHHGVLMAEAKGKAYFDTNEDMRAELSEKKKRVDRKQVPNEVTDYKEEVILQLNSLQVLDLLTAQVDRHLRNIVIEKQGKYYVQAKGIDNDMCFGTLTFEQLMERDEEEASRVSPNIRKLENADGFIFRVLNRNLYENLLALTDDMVKYVFADLLSKKELKCLLNRIHAVQKIFAGLEENEDLTICTPDKMSARDRRRIRNRQRECISCDIPIDLTKFEY